MADAAADEVELTMVTMSFDALDPERAPGGARPLRGAQPGPRRAAGTSTCACPPPRPNRFVIVQKWERPEDQQAHFDSADMVTMAEGCVGLLATRPAIDLLEAISAHDLN